MSSLEMIDDSGVELYYEQLFQKKIYDASIYPFSLNWSCDNILAVTTKSAVHVYVPNITNLMMYSVGWISLVSDFWNRPDNFSIHQLRQKSPTFQESYRKLNEGSEISGDLLMKLLDKAYLNSEAEITMLSADWSPVLIDGFNSGVLVIHLSNDSVLFLERSHNSNGVYILNEIFEVYDKNEKVELFLKGYTVVYEFNIRFHKLFKEIDMEMSIKCFKIHQSTIGTLFISGSKGNISVWIIRSDPSLHLELLHIFDCQPTFDKIQRSESDYLSTCPKCCTCPFPHSQPHVFTALNVIENHHDYLLLAAGTLNGLVILLQIRWELVGKKKMSFEVCSCTSVCKQSISCLLSTTILSSSNTVIASSGSDIFRLELESGRDLIIPTLMYSHTKPITGMVSIGSCIATSSLDGSVKLIELLGDPSPSFPEVIYQSDPTAGLTGLVTDSLGYVMVTAVRVKINPEEENNRFGYLTKNIIDNVYLERLN